MQQLDNKKTERGCKKSLPVKRDFSVLPQFAENPEKPLPSLKKDW